MPKYLTAYQLASYVTKIGFRKFRQIKCSDGRYIYEVKGLTESEWLILEMPDDEFTDEEKDAMTESGGWIILDGFTAQAIKQVFDKLYETKGADEVNAKFNSLRLNPTIINFVWKVVG